MLYNNDLTSVTVGSSDPLSLSVSVNVFGDNDLSAATLYVPFGSKVAYEEALVWQVVGTIIEKAITGVDNEIGLLSLDIYPNHATDLIHVPSGEYIFYSKLGKVIDFGLSDGTIDVSKLDGDGYFLKAGSATGKFIIE